MANPAEGGLVVTLWMYPIAHIVAASGAAWGAERVAWRLFRPSRAGAASGPGEPSRRSLFDFRLVALGSWLPDMIDKPLSWFILRWVVEDDHLFAHTLLFASMLAIPALYFAWRGKASQISLSSGVIMHRLCDPIWPETETVLWPVYGWTFRHSTGPPFVYYLLLEIAGAAILWVVLRQLWKRDRICRPLSEGQI